MREVTVTIDDGGMHPAVNAAIDTCIPSGNIGRVSIMATGPCYAEAIMSTMAGGVRLGAHLDCCQGPFLLPESDFPGSFAAWLKSAEALSAKVRKEWSAQIEKILSTGGVVTALDSHRHMHHIPALQDVIISLAGEYGIRTVRSAVLPDRFSRFPAGLKLNSLGKDLQERLRGEGFVTADRMLGFGRAGRITLKYLKKHAGDCAEGTTEMVMHPATEEVWSAGQTGELELILSREFGEWCENKN